MACKDLSKLSTEVLRLRLQNLNLLIIGSRPQLVQNLRRALGSSAAMAANEPGWTGDGHVIKPHSGRQRVQRTRTGKNCRVAAEPAVSKTSTIEQLASDKEVDEFSDARSSVDDLLSLPAVPTDSADQLFTPAHLSAIQDTISSSISAALTNLPHSGNTLLDLVSSRYSAVSRLTSLYFFPIFCISPSLPIFSSDSRTRPQASRVPC